MVISYFCYLFMVILLIKKMGINLKRILNEKFSISLIVFGLSVILFALTGFLYKASLFNFEAKIDGALFGQFGDVIGGVVGSFWALAGVILFYVGLTEQRKAIQLNETALLKQIDALVIQKEEMGLLRTEYKMARKVFEQQRDTAKEQVKTNAVQQFESNFYALINIYTHITDQLFGENGDLTKINADFREKFKSNIGLNKSFLERHNLAKSLYINIYQENSIKIAHYLKTVYRIFKVIEERTDFSDREKYFYAKIIRSQFTDEELFIIYYNALSSYGSNFRNLILKYNLLKHFYFLAKLECDKSSVNCFETLYFKECLSDFIEESLADFSMQVDDLSNLEPSHSSVFFHNEMVLNFDFSISSEEYLVVDVFCNPEVLLELNISKAEFDFFVGDFILDRVIFHNFCLFGDEDVMKYENKSNDHLRLVLESDSKIKVSRDLY